MKLETGSVKMKKFFTNLKKRKQPVKFNAVNEAEEILEDLTYLNDTVEGAILGVEERLETLNSVINEINSWSDDLEVDLNSAWGYLSETEHKIREAAFELGLDETDIWSKLDGTSQKELDRTALIEEKARELINKIRQINNLDI